MRHLKTVLAVIGAALVIVLAGNTVSLAATGKPLLLGKGNTTGKLTTLSRTLPELGAGIAATLIIVGQLMVGLVVDHFGWFGVPVRPIDITRLVAAALLLAGGYLMVR